MGEAPTGFFDIGHRKFEGQYPPCFERKVALTVSSNLPSD
jgi:hypothetical protein